MCTFPRRFFAFEASYPSMSTSFPAADTTTLVQHAYAAGQDILRVRSQETKKQLGQFLTPPPLARYMARRVVQPKKEVHILDPAVGSGVLLCAAIEQIIARGYTETLHVTGYDVDAPLAACARSALEQVQQRAQERGIKMQYTVKTADFILDQVPNNKPSLFDDAPPASPPAFDAIIANPPYFKLRRDAPQSQAAQGYLEGHTNIYTLFMGLAARLLRPDGRACFVVPRSFCSGAYFKAFRIDFLRHATPQHIHLFTARNEAFEDEAVLQENVVISFSGTGTTDEFTSLTRSVSQGLRDLDTAHSHKIDASVFKGDTPQGVYYRLPTTTLDERIVTALDAWAASFATHDLAVSTGPVVAFRNRSLLTNAEAVAQGNAVPLYWMQNIQPDAVTWPTDRGDKPQGLIVDDDTADSLALPRANYVLIRRFSSKEDRRRLTAAPFLADTYEHDYVSFENHLNYVYQTNGSLNCNEAHGLSALLNSALVDRYFRILNGNIQVNATDLKSLPLPSRDTIAAIGERIAKHPENNRNAAVFEVLRTRGYLPNSIPTFTETRFTVGKIQEG